MEDEEDMEEGLELSQDTLRGRKRQKVGDEETTNEDRLTSCRHL